MIFFLIKFKLYNFTLNGFSFPENGHSRTSAVGNELINHLLQDHALTHTDTPLPPSPSPTHMHTPEKGWRTTHPIITTHTHTFHGLSRLLQKILHRKPATRPARRRTQIPTQTSPPCCQAKTTRMWKGRSRVCIPRSLLVANPSLYPRGNNRGYSVAVLKSLQEACV